MGDRRVRQIVRWPTVRQRSIEVSDLYWSRSKHCRSLAPWPHCTQSYDPELLGFPVGLWLTKATVTPDRTISGSYDWLRLCQDATDRQCLLRSPAAVAYRDRCLRVVTGHAITNDWRISMARAIVVNHATSGIDQRPMYDQS